MSLTPDHTLDEVATALGMSPRWVRQKVKEGAVHNRYGHKIRFTDEQVRLLKESCTKRPVEESVTTGRGKKSA